MESENSVVVTAPSVEEAIILGLTRLTTTRDEVDIEVLDEGSSGFLGLGAREARVRVTRLTKAQLEARAAAEAAAEAKAQAQAEAEARAAAEAKAAKEAEAKAAVEQVVEDVDATPAAVEEVAVKAQEAPQAEMPEPLAPGEKPGTPELREQVEQAALDVAEHVLAGLDVEVKTSWKMEDRPTLWVSLEGRDADTLVGPRAQTLAAVQYVFRAVVHERVDKPFNLVVDADGYRRRRRRSLKAQAREMAEQAVESGRTVRMRSMPAHERRIVHILLRKDERVETESVGRGRDRAVTIIPLKS